jgi:hypothetical protein
VVSSLHISFFLVVVLLAGGLAGAAPVEIQPMALELPIACRLGETCWVANYVDVGPGTAAQDFRCEVRTYDGHDGIDLAVRDLAEMKRGVAVQAVAPGIVRRVRDGVADVGLVSSASREAIAGRECGNGVIIDHGGGWETQYCHLKQQSLQVKAGQQVEREQTLGQVGLSGKTEFPHVHLTVRHNGQVIDPFTGQSQNTGCHPDGRPLWRDPSVAYEAVALYNIGFSAAEPQAAAVRNGQRGSDTISSDAPALVLWVDMFGIKAGDQLRFRITAPDGRVMHDHTTRIERTQARRFSFSGVRRQTGRWPSGVYNGEVRLQRGQGKTDFSRTVIAKVQMF